MFGVKPSATWEPPAPASPLSGLPGGPEGGGSEVHILDRLSVVYRYRKVVVTVVTLVIVAGVVQTYTTIPEYQATATVEISKDRPAVSGLVEADDSDVEAFRATELSILQSRDLARRVVKPLELADNVEINGKAPQSTGVSAVIAAIRTRLSHPFEAFMSGKPKGPVAPAIPTDTAPRDPEGDLAAAFVGHLTVTPQGGSNLVNVTVTAKNAEFTAKAANAIVEAFETQNLEIGGSAFQ